MASVRRRRKRLSRRSPGSAANPLRQTAQRRRTRLAAPASKGTDSAGSNARLMAHDGAGRERERLEAELAAL